MPSPFPGMDPYLESELYWRDLHLNLIAHIQAALQPSLVPKYVARVDTRQYVEVSARPVYSDVGIYAGSGTLREAPAVYEVSTNITQASVPWIVKAQRRWLDEEIEEGFLHILLRDTRELVTAIEVISSGNKATGDGRDKYLQKQREVLSSNANLVEIDLLREGRRLTPEPIDAQGRRADYRYIVCVNRANKREQNEMYPLTLSDALPRFNIPLRAPDADIVLDLQSVFEQCYVAGAYQVEVDYSQLPEAKLTSQERELVMRISAKTQS